MKNKSNPPCQTAAHQLGRCGTHVALVAVVRRLVFDPTLVADFFPLGDQLIPQDLDVLHGLQQAVPVRRKRSAVRPYIMKGPPVTASTVRTHFSIL